MSETLSQQLQALAVVLRWFERHREANLLENVAHLLRSEGIEKFEQLIAHIGRLDDANAEEAALLKEESVKPLTEAGKVTLALLACEISHRANPDQFREMAFEVLSDAERCNQHIMAMLRTGMTDAVMELPDAITHWLRSGMLVGDVTSGNFCQVFAAPNSLLEAAKLFHPDHDFVIDEL